jgi:FtsP/CotA-like multicopper oxidase with cupredoxin domain
VKNCLSVPVSVFIPGQLKALAPVHENTDGTGRMRVTSFDTLTLGGGLGSYIWTGVKEGTYLYHSGTHPQVQVQMGLYGALVVNNGGSYPAVAQDEVLLYSEIDPALHAAVDGGTYGTPAYPSTFDYQPKYFLINGTAYPDTPDIVLNTSEDVLLRFVNAGLKTHIPTLQGLYMSVIAEDGNLYPDPKDQYSIELTAAKTMDAVVNAGTADSYALYDRSLHLTNSAATGGGMLTYLQVVDVAGAPTALDDAYATDEDIDLIVAAPGVLGNDTADGGGPLPIGSSANLVSDVSGGTLTLIADGSFTYSPNLNFNGTDIFTYKAKDGTTVIESNVATVRITVNPVNDPPVANDDVASTDLNTPVDINVVTNDTDIDGNLDPNSANTDCATCSVPNPLSGALTNNLDGTFTFTPTLNFSGSDTFVYEVCDTALECDTATVNITVSAVPPANIAPFANDDFAETPKNTAVTFSVTGNDVDADGSIDVTSVVITTGLNTQRGGEVVENGDGTVTFTPKNGFRGTDTFKYTVDDNLGLTSNEATVRVNVTR